MFSVMKCFSCGDELLSLQPVKTCKPDVGLLDVGVGLVFCGGSDTANTNLRLYCTDIVIATTLHEQKC